MGNSMGNPDSSSAPGRSFAGLFDPHVHTELAGCAEDITASAALERARELNLSIGFSEHADQLYFPREDYARYETEAGKLSALGAAARAGHSRFAAYRQLLAPIAAQGVPIGLEVEAAEDSPGLALLDEDRGGWDYLLGAVHEFRQGQRPWTPSVAETTPDGSAATLREAAESLPRPGANLARDFMVQVEKLCAAGVQVLAHPFRVFIRKGREVPRQLYRPVAEILAAHQVAAEINFHTNQPDPEFFALCLELGARLSVGSDAHAMWEVGALGPHLALLREIGAMDRLEEVLWRPCLKR